MAEEEEEEVPGPWEPERPWKGTPRSGAGPDGSGGRGPQEPPRSTREQEEEEEEEEEGSCCSEGEDSSNVYLYYTLGERWIDYLQRTGDGGLLRHLRPKVTRDQGLLRHFGHLREGKRGTECSVMPGCWSWGKRC